MSVKFEMTTLESVFEATWPVTVNVPQDGGTVQEQVFNARFRMLSPDTIEALQEGDDADAYLSAFFVGLPDDAKTAEDFERLKALMFAQPNIRIALIRAYAGFQAGVAVKN